MAKTDIEHHENKITEDFEGKRPTIHASFDGNYVYINHHRYPKHELLNAFGGAMNPGWTLPSVHKFANPAPLGLSAFAFVTFVSSIINIGARDVHHDNVMNGASMFYGGFIQLLAGMWEISLENTFGGLAFASYGGYWMGSASMNISWFDSNNNYTSELEKMNALGFYYLGWLFFTTMMLICTLKSTFWFFILFVLVFGKLLMLTAWGFSQKNSCLVAAGCFGVMASLLAWYHAYAGLATDQNTYYVVKPIPMPIFSKKGIRWPRSDEDESAVDNSSFENSSNQEHV